ncbi:MAG: glycosyltransferase [Syntrophothermus sp.]|uniref:glycosyltransferase n=1 Tax=Syntrophothermus sp. TaxID=2736299 RepID=UPI002580A0A3|nr:glycosyltransferase [Syntrophothermus sp.]NSW81928.1 glycosyltransferase [Syntrophothermus sp.]
MRDLCRQLVRFSITGVVNTLIDFGLFNILVFFTGARDGWQVGLINIVAVGVAAANSYFMNRRWTFQTRGKHETKEIVRFIPATIVGMLINSAVVSGISALVYWIPLPVYIVLNTGKLLGTVFSATWNFMVYRLWVFVSTETDEAEGAVRLAPEVMPGLVSIVIPAYNEKSRLPGRLKRLAELAPRRFPVEIIVVNDGSTDNTRDLAEMLAMEYPIIRCISHPRNLGKGAAVRTGVLASRGEYVVYTDADETFSVEHIEQVVTALREGHQVAAGCRDAGRGKRLRNEKALRHLMGRAFNLLVQALVLPGVRDTQCGLKGFTQAAAREVFGRQRLNRFAFDVEVLALVRALNFDLVLVPVTAVDCEGSSVNRLLAPLQMIWDVFRVRLALEMNVYGLPDRGNCLTELLIAVMLFATALAVRLPWLWQVPRYIDELKEVNLAYAIYRGQILPLHNVAHDIGAMHNYILAGLFKLFGPNIYLPRLYVAVTGALTVAVVYFLGKRMFDRYTGILAAALLLTNGMHMLVTHMAWANSTTPFFFSLALLATLKAEDEKNGKWLLTAALLWAATLQTHSSAIIYVLAAAVYVFSPAFRRKTQLTARWYAAAVVVFLAGYANMIYYNIISRGGSITWLGHKGYALEHHPGLHSFLVNLTQLLVELTRAVSSTYASHNHLWEYLQNPLLVLASVLLLAGCCFAYRQGERLLLSMLLSGILVIPWINHRYTFYLATRYIMPEVICAVVLISLGLVTGAFFVRQKLKDVVVNTKTIEAPVTAVLLLVIACQAIPFYTYCRRLDSTNLSNRAALKVMSIVDEEAGRNSMVLLDQRLPLENQPLPYLLTLSHQSYVLVSNKSGRQGAQARMTWVKMVDRYSRRKLIAVLSQQTYSEIKNYIPEGRTYSVKSRMIFPRVVAAPRVIYVVEIRNADEPKGGNESSSPKLTEAKPPPAVEPQPDS